MLSDLISLKRQLLLLIAHHNDAKERRA